MTPCESWPTRLASTRWAAMRSASGFWHPAASKTRAVSSPNRSGRSFMAPPARVGAAGTSVQAGPQPRRARKAGSLRVAQRAHADLSEVHHVAGAGVLHPDVPARGPLRLPLRLQPLAPGRDVLARGVERRDPPAV